MRSYATKMPHFFFSAVPLVTSVTRVFVSEPDFMTMVNTNILDQKDEDGNYSNKERFDKETVGYDWPDGIPKESLFVKLNPDISEKEREYTLNGIRNYLKRTDLMLTQKDVQEALASINLVFNIFVGIVAIIALFIAFFLLLIAMTQNINDAIWEYGVLRSIGLT